MLKPDDKRKLSDNEWNAIKALLTVTGADEEIIVDTCRGELSFIDREEDRPLSQEPTLKLLAEKYIKKTFEEYGFSPDECSILSSLFSD